MGKPSGQMPHQGLGKADQLVGNSRGVHYICGHDKEGDRQKNEGIVGLQHPLQKHYGSQPGFHKQNRHNRQGQGIGNRNS